MADIPMKVTLVFPATANVSPFKLNQEFILESTTHCLTIDNLHYAPKDGEMNEPDGPAIRHYVILQRRHGIGIAAGHIVGTVEVDPPDQATGMWVAEPQGR